MTESEDWVSALASTCCIYSIRMSMSSYYSVLQNSTNFRFSKFALEVLFIEWNFQARNSTEMMRQAMTYLIHSYSKTVTVTFLC